MDGSDDKVSRLAELVASMPDEPTAAVLRHDLYALALGGTTIGTYDPSQRASIQQLLDGMGLEDIQRAVGPISSIG